VSLPQSVSAPPASDVATSTQWFADEVQPHESRLRNWVRRRFPWVTDVDDLVHDCYARILRARRAGKVEHARSYLFVMARNAAFDLARRERVAPIEGIADLAELAVVEDGPDAAESVSREEELELLADAIEALPQRCRLVVKLRKLRGLSHEEIAAQLDISPHTVNAQLAKGMSLCREYLRQRGLVS